MQWSWWQGKTKLSTSTNTNFVVESSAAEANPSQSDVGSSPRYVTKIKIEMRRNQKWASEKCEGAHPFVVKPQVFGTPAEASNNPVLGTLQKPWKVMHPNQCRAHAKAQVFCGAGTPRSRKMPTANRQCQYPQSKKPGRRRKCCSGKPVSPVKCSEWLPNQRFRRQLNPWEAR